MTGPEHYREAERLLKVAAESDGVGRSGAAVLLAAAQVHATLAHAAAVAAQDIKPRWLDEGYGGYSRDRDDRRAWLAAFGGVR